MRRFPLLCLTAFLWSAIQLHAATYYVATNGSDTNAGTLAAPFLTIQKAASVAVAGDVVCVRAGTYRETVTPVNSGTVNSPITFQPYNGETVTISGADVVTGWTLDSGAIYKAPLSGTFFTSTMNQADQIFVDGTMMTLARWPNTTTATNAYPTGTAPAVDISHPAKSTITSFISKTADTPSVNYYQGVVADTALPSQAANYYAGAKIFFQPDNGAWSWAFSGDVTASSGTQLTFKTLNGNGSDGNSAIYKTGSRYYLFDKKEFLDAPGEWWHDTANGQLYLMAPGSDNPSSHLVEAKKRDYAFDCSNRNYITIKGFKLFACTITTDTAAGGSAQGYDSSGNAIYPWRGANSTASSTGVVIDGIDAKYLNHFTDISGHFFMQWGTGTGIVLSGSGHTLRNSHLQYAAGNGVNLMGRGHVVYNNLIEDTDYSAVDCSGINVTSAGTSTDHEIAYNTVVRTGRSGMTPRSLANSNAAGGAFTARIHHNNVSQFGLQDWDVGALYAASNDGQFSRIDHNTFSEGVGYTSAGVYLDFMKNHVIDHNVVWNVEWGIKLQGNNGGENNALVYHNTVAVRNTSSATYGPFGIGNGSGTNVGTVLKNNILTCNNLPSSGYAPISSANFTSAEIASNLSWDGVANSSTDPKFTNPATTLNATSVDYRILAGSKAIDNSATVPSYVRDGITVPPFADDYNGTAPDAGAFELSAAALVAGYGDPSLSTSPCAEPIPSPWAGNYTAAVTVSLRSLTPGASIRYTTDGSTPTSTTGTLYTGPFSVPATATVKSIAFLNGRADSTVSSSRYTITPPPVSTVSSSSLSADLTQGGSITSPFNLGNTGPGTLNYTLTIPRTTAYTFLTSRDAGGPTYTWQDISSDTTGGGTGTGGGTRLTALDNQNDASTQIASMGITFPFYGSNFTSVRVCTNGFLSFTDASTAATNSASLPNSSAPANLVAPLFMDFRTDSSSAIYYKLQDASTFIVQFQNVKYRNTSQRVTFQVVLRASGEIEYRYKATSLTNLTQTIGIQDGTRTQALQIAYNPTSAYITSTFSIKISPPSTWFDITPTAGSVAGGTSTGLTATFSAGTLALGTYTGTLTINSNDPQTPVRSIPVTLNVVSSVSPPPAPASPAIAAAASPTTGATLTWTDVAGETSYTVERSSDGTTWTLLATLPPGSTTYTDPAPAPGTWQYRVKAINAGGASATAALTATYATPGALAYESITQAAGTSLSAGAAASGAGFGTWTTATGSPATAVAGSLVYTAGGQSTAAFGQSLRRTSFGQSRLSFNLAAGSPLANAGFVTAGALGGSNADGKTLYLSFLVSGAATTNDTLVVLEDGSANQLLGVRAQQNRWALQKLAGYQALTGITPDPSTTYLIVLRIDFASGNDTCRLYVNPTSLSAEPATADASFNDFPLDTIASLSFFTNNTGTWTFDELRVGTRWSDVVPIRPTTLTPAAANPTFNPAAGTYSGAQSVTLASATSGASIRYTTDGSTPTSSTGTLYTGPISVTATTTLKAIAYKSGLADSSVATGTYTISAIQTYALTVNGGSGSNNYPAGTVVNISADPAPYGQVFAAWTGSTAGLASTTAPSTTYTMPAAPATLTATYTSVDVTTGRQGYYRFDETSGSTAFDSSGNGRDATLSGATFDTTGGKIGGALKVVNATDKASFSSISTSTFAVSAWFKPNSTGGGTFGRILDAPGYRLYISPDSSGGGYHIRFQTIRSTTNGAFDTPNNSVTLGTWTHVSASYDSSSLSNQPTIYLNGSPMPITVFASPAGAQVDNAGTAYWGNNAASTRNWDGWIDEATIYNTTLSAAQAAVLASIPPSTVATPTFSPPAGTYSSTQSVTISTTTSGATIRYTTDGSTPSRNSGTLYSGPVTISSGVMLKAIAYQSGSADSAIASATYAFSPFYNWQMSNFGTTSGTGADNADPDGDGIPNLLEYAFNTDPNSAAARSLPAADLVASGGQNHLRLSFTRVQSRSDINYTVEASSDLVTWTAIAQSVTGAATADISGRTLSVTETGSGDARTVSVVDAAAAGTSGRYMRVRVTRP